MNHWRERYDDLARRLPGLAREARPVLCGLGLCVDVYIRLSEAGPLLAAPAGSPAAALAAELLGRAASGVGGEIRVDWPQGADWLDRHLPEVLGLGGTGAQAAQVLAILGAPTLLALPERSARQLRLIHPEVRAAASSGIVPLREIDPAGRPRPAHYIVEFTAGIPAGPVVPPRSSRVIVRFADDPLEPDPEFIRESVQLAPRAGAAILSGFNELPPGDLPSVLRWVRSLAGEWQAAGLQQRHLELGDFPTLGEMQEVLAGLSGSASSLGLSYSELCKLLPDDGSLATLAHRLADRHGFRRVAIHADHWALAITRDDPQRELEALMAGSLIAATRAWKGHIAVPERCPPGAEFASPPAPEMTRRGDWHVVCCATPYLCQPAATIGLGDTFLAGSMLVLSQPDRG
jgi:ADP-dependent phosphofructokinase/glucokinase